jgi:disulfide bond formation protein DsbB
MRFSVLNVSRFLAVVSAAAIFFALTAQYAFGYPPCALCITQRWWHGVVIGLGIATFFITKPTRLLELQAMALIICFGYACFHIGVEQHWWGGTAACTGPGLGTGKSAAEMMTQIMATPVARCDQPSWFLFGFSMAVYNAVLTFCMAAAAVFTLFKKRWIKPA